MGRYCALAGRYCELAGRYCALPGLGRYCAFVGRYCALAHMRHERGALCAARDLRRVHATRCVGSVVCTVDRKLSIQ